MSKFVNINGTYYNTAYFYSVELVPLPDGKYGIEIKTTREFKGTSSSVGYYVIRTEPTSMQGAQLMLDKILGVD